MPLRPDRHVRVAAEHLRRHLPRTQVHHLDRRAESTSDLGKAAGAEIAVNGSYFNVKTFEPVTFVLLDRKIVGRTTPEEAFRTNGVIAFKDRKGRRMEIFPCDTTQYAARRWPQARC